MVRVHECSKCTDQYRYTSQLGVYAANPDRQLVRVHEYSKYRSTEVYLTDQQLVRVHEYTRELEVYAVIHCRQFVQVHEHNKYRSTEVYMIARSVCRNPCQLVGTGARVQ